MSGPVHALVPAPTKAGPSRQHPPAPKRRLSERGDASEREADRAADVVARGGSVSSWSFSALPSNGMSTGPAATSRSAKPVQRDEPKVGPAPKGEPKDEKEKYVEAAAKVGEAALETKEGKALKDKILNQPTVKKVVDAASSPAGIATIVGGIGVGAAGLAAAGKELPVPLPSIPLDKVLPGMSAKITAKGPLNAPTELGLVLTFREQGPKDKQKAKAREKEQLAAQVAELRAFQEGLRTGTGGKSAGDRQLDDAIARVVARNSLFPGLFIPLDPTKRAVPAPTAEKPKDPTGGPGADTTTEEGGTGTPRGATDDVEKKVDEAAPVQRERASESSGGATRAGDAPSVDTIDNSVIDNTVDSTTIDGSLIDNTVSTGGRALDPSTRHHMEARFGTDFSSVRIHDDAGAAATAGRIDAAAFTTGNDIVFGTGHFDPRSPEGRHLLAHELAHVVQQDRSETGARMVHRRGVGEWLGILFGAEEGNWSNDELTEYLALITRTGKIDGSYDADNKARAVVARWKAGDVAFAVNPAQKVLLIEEMLDGPTLIEDETAIVDLLVDGTPDDGATVLGPTGVHLDRIEADVDDKVQRARLAKWLTDSFAGGRDAVLAGRINTIQSTVEGFEALTTGTVAKDDAAPVVQVPKIVVDAMAEAWSKSFPKGKSKEQGGILVRKKDGSVEWIKATKSASGWTELPEEKIPKGGAGLVAGHTHPYDKSELKSIKDPSPEARMGIGQSGGDFETLVFQKSPVDIVHAGNKIIAIVKTKEFNDAVAAAKTKKSKEKLGEKIGKDWKAIFKAATGTIQKRIRDAAKGICKQYGLVMYEGGADGLITKVDVDK